MIETQATVLQLDTDKKLEDYLKQMCQKSAEAGSGGLTAEKRAYVEGLEDALKLVCLHRQQCAENENPVSKVPAEQAMDEDSTPKLFQMSPDDVFKLNLDEDDDTCQKHFQEDELIEAAFRFENELMALLGDENCIDWSVYAGMTSQELIRVIKKSVSDICRFSKG